MHTLLHRASRACRLPAAAQPLTPAEVAKIDQIVTTNLSQSGVPSAEIAVVRDGRIVLDKAYGKANEHLPARPDLALSDRVQLQAVHGDGAASARGRGQAQPRRPRLEISSRNLRRRPHHHPPIADATPPGIAGLLAAGLHVRGHEQADHAAAHRRQMGEEAARLPARRPVAIFATPAMSSPG